MLIFDLDGTLLCTQHHVFAAVRDTLHQLGLPQTDREAIIRNIGETSAVFCRAIAPDYPDTAHFMTCFRNNEHTALKKHGQLFDGVAELLLRLREMGFRLVICSNGSSEYIHLALQTTHIEHLFHAVVSAKSFESKAQAVRHLVDTAPCDNIVMIGDRYQDYRAAQEALIPSVAALYGYGRVDEAEQATFSASAPQEILPLICQITLYSQLYSRIQQKPGVRCIGINGIDTSGKSVFAGRFSAFLQSRGRSVQLIHVDDFHNPKALRRQGSSETAAYIANAFDLTTLTNELLIPLHRDGKVSKALTLLDLDSDSYTLQRQYTITETTLVILEGVLLYRPPLEKYIDYKVFLDIDFDEMLHRAYSRDRSRYGEQVLQKYREKYIPIQRWYLEVCRPKETSDAVIDNNDFQAPFIL